MKKAIIITGVFLMLMTSVAFGAAIDRQRFVEDVENEIYDGRQTGQLTNSEVRTLRNQLENYEDKLWEFTGYGRLSRQEEKVLLRMEERLIDSLEDLKFNRVTTYSQRNYPRRNSGGFYDRRPGIYYGTTYGRSRRPATRSRATVTRRAPRRGGGTYCPPPRRGSW